MRKEIGSHLVMDSEICHGKLTVKGTRIMAATVIEQLSNNKTIDQVHESWDGRLSHAAIAEIISIYAKLLFTRKNKDIERLIAKKEAV